MIKKPGYCSIFCERSQGEKLFFHHSIPETDNPIRVSCEVGCVSDHDDGLALSVELCEEIHDLASCDGVEIPGWFIREDDLRVIEEGTGDGDALLLSSRELAGHTREFIGESESVHECRRSCESFGGIGSRIDSRECDVFEGVETGEKIELLEDKTNFAIADIGERLIVPEIRYIVSFEEESASGEGMEESDDIEECGFARSTLAHERDEFSFADDEINIPEYGNLCAVREVVGLLEILQLDNRRSCPRLRFCEMGEDSFDHKSKSYLSASTGSSFDARSAG